MAKKRANGEGNIRIGIVDGVTDDRKDRGDEGLIDFKVEGHEAVEIGRAHV